MTLHRFYFQPCFLIFLTLFTLSGLHHTNASAQTQQEAPDAMVRRVSTEVLESARQDPAIQQGDRRRIVQLVQEKILPHIDFERTTALTAGRYWRQANPDQQRRLVEQFSTLLIHTYAGALSQVRDETLHFQPLRPIGDASEVEVRSQVARARAGETIELNYRLIKSPEGWKIYDMNVGGFWLIEAYKSNFASQITKNGVDGLIAALAERNQKLAAMPIRASSNGQG